MRWLLDEITAWLAAAILDCFDALLHVIATSLLVTPDVTGLPQVRALAGRSVWVVDTVFVVAFIAAGVAAMVAGGDERTRYTVKDLVPRLVVGFIVAHFSQPLLGRATAVANALVAGLTPGDADRPGALQMIRGYLHAAADSSVPVLFAALAAVITVLLAATMFSLLARLAVLLVLAAVAPLALACHALPATDPVARLWWRSSGGCLAVPVLQAFTLQAGQWMLQDQAHVLPLLGVPGDPGAAVNLFVVVVLLWTTVKVPSLVRRYVTHTGRGGSAVASMVRVVVVQQTTRGLGRGLRGPARAVTR